MSILELGALRCQALGGADDPLALSSSPPKPLRRCERASRFGSGAGKEQQRRETTGPATTGPSPQQGCGEARRAGTWGGKEHRRGSRIKTAPRGTIWRNGWQCAATARAPCLPRL